MPFGLSKERYKKIKAVFSRFSVIEEVLVFGSRAMDTYKPASDIDLALVGDKITHNDVLKVSAALDELPYGYTYDVVNYKKISRQEFKDHIDKFGISFYKKEHAPEGWETVRLDELGKILNSKRVPLNSRERQNRKGPFPYYGASGIIDNVDDFLFEGEHVLISEDGENLRSRQTPIAFKADGRFWVNNHAHIFKGDTEQINDFIVYYFQNTNLSPYLTGAVQPKLNKENLLRIPIQFQSRETAEEIASILSSLDNKIELNLQMNETLEAMAQAIFREWFVNFNYPGATGKLVDGLPEGWKIGKLGEELDITMGQSPPGSSYNEDGEGEVFFQGRTDFGFRFPTARMFTTESKRLARKFDTLVSVRAPVGDLNMAMEDCCIGRGVAAVRHKRGWLSYTYYLMYSIQRDLKGFESEGTVFGSMNKTDFENIDLIVPQKEVVIKFEELVEPIDERIFINSLEVSTLTKLRNSLLPKLMTGKIKVPA